MSTPKNTCPDCKLTKVECICTDRCDFCGELEDECKCGLDTDPYGHKVYDNKLWHREMEDSYGDHEYQSTNINP